MYSCWHKFFTLFVFSFTCQWSVAQITTDPTSNSPYSRLGLGDPVGQYFSSNAGMAGISSVYHHPYHLNVLNPASHGWLRSTAFEVGVFAKFTALDSQGASTQEWDGNLNYLAIGFPLRNPINESLDRKEPDFGWGMSFSLIPNTIVNYDIETSSEVGGENTIGAFKGEGGTYKLYWGNGFRYKYFSAGLNLGYLFGRIRNTRLLFLEDEFAYYSDNFADDISVNGFVWNLGLNYDLFFKEKWTWRVGK
ncbi:MAG: hypothetical protein HC892_04295 [Saprospiraceae bacterium]|nr:hypothetical protein [Saprospiraceae bacterium]